MPKTKKAIKLLKKAEQHVTNPEKRKLTEDFLWDALTILGDIIPFPYQDETIEKLNDLYENLKGYYTNYYDTEDESSLSFLEDEIKVIINQAKNLVPPRVDIFGFEVSSDSSNETDTEASDSELAVSDIEVQSDEEAQDYSEPLQPKLKSIDDFYDSSDDEAHVEKNPYPNVSSATPTQIHSPKIVDKLTKIKTNFAEIKGKAPQAHQHLLRKPAVEGEIKKDKRKKSPSPFAKALLDPKKLLDASPSCPSKAKENVIIPSFRGIAWKGPMTGAQLFFATRVSWVGEHSYASQAFSLAKINIHEHTQNYFIHHDLQDQYPCYDLSLLNQAQVFNLEINNQILTQQAKVIKNFFAYTDKIKKPFTEWLNLFSSINLDLRNSKKLNRKELTFTEILSYSYVNNYEAFKKDFKSITKILEPYKNQPEVIALLDFLKKLPVSLEILSEAMPFLSEGQIPRHALLYAFQLKIYTKNNQLEAVPLYQPNFRPKKQKTYLGKLLINNNPFTLFSNKDKAVYIPDQDKNERIDVSKAIIGEREIQHQGGNLFGKIEKSINIKLPKFHHDTAPNRYLDKYGINNDIYIKFKNTFAFLISHNEYGKLSWMYAETLLCAHLIHFHEIQLYKYCNTMTKSSDKIIDWHDRKEIAIKNPFKF